MHEYAHGLAESLFATVDSAPSLQPELPKEAITVVADAEGWTRCPKCNFRFSTRFTGSFENGIHKNCGQRLNVIFNAPRNA
jgi:hypothetical protein